MKIGLSKTAFIVYFADTL